MNPAAVSPEAFGTWLRGLLCIGCLAYLATGSTTLVLGHCFGVLSLPFNTAMMTFLMWWMIIPVLPAVILHPVAVRRMRVLHRSRAHTILRGFHES